MVSHQIIAEEFVANRFPEPLNRLPCPLAENTGNDEIAIVLPTDALKSQSQKKGPIISGRLRVFEGRICLDFRSLLRVCIHYLYQKIP